MLSLLLAPSALAGTVSFFVEVSARRSDHRDWDARPGEQPEIMVIIERSSSSYECDSGYTCSTGNLNIEGDTFAVTVFDKDLRNHDFIGEASCSISARSCSVTRGSDQLLVVKMK